MAMKQNEKELQDDKKKIEKYHTNLKDKELGIKGWLP